MLRPRVFDWSKIIYVSKELLWEFSLAYSVCP